MTSADCFSLRPRYEVLARISSYLFFGGGGVGLSPDVVGGDSKSGGAQSTEQPAWSQDGVGLTDETPQKLLVSGLLIL